MALHATGPATSLNVIISWVASLNQRIAVLTSTAVQALAERAGLEPVNLVNVSTKAVVQKGSATAATVTCADGAPTESRG